MNGAMPWAVLDQAVLDALQTSNASLRTEALRFLEVVAPDVAEDLRTGYVPIAPLAAQRAPGEAPPLL